ncbi:hypothetical protein EXU57_10665 [Segetibacter sp. 3557_3]|uniref:right-handed parallel beta-helix repeat-containing protein n=1 Tax=Segetibacter sp. 3557_3 TaxID=2547429 RepID=UPI0010588D99|nr:right-handed parallel beta-helix repeat-containing protein [Segetibacter sp. 3557_3]TDH26545.1 hypothetical protein EXU57_10665 [Segetibacter sp. 3557_3]
MRLRYFLFLLIFATTAAHANYTSPGTGVRWSIADLVTNANGNISFASGVYTVNDTIFISATDTLQILADATVKFAAATHFHVFGTLIINPPSSVIFTPVDVSARFNGIRVESSHSTVLRKLTMEYANAVWLFDSNIRIDSCVFRNNTAQTTFGNGAISLFRSSPVITNSQFIDNHRAAVTGGANINNAPTIIGCLFSNNNTMNLNVPQINLGSTGNGTDTVKILNNRIVGGPLMAGAIGFLPVGGSVYAVISGNLIKNNRYGISLNGGANINTLISYNVIDSNNIQNDPNLGGSGIAFTGGTATSHQNSVVTGNFFRGNLWGITIQQRAQPILGNITNTDTTDDGKNIFIGNTNATTPFIDLYNNTVDSIYAQNNYWGTTEPNAVEARIFHTPDNASLGFVNYLPFMNSSPLPSGLLRFSGQLLTNEVYLSWKTASLTDKVFEIEKSTDGQRFSRIGTIAVNGTSTTARDYNYTDRTPGKNSKLYYRLKTIDRDNQVSYSGVLVIKLQNEMGSHVKVYPTVILGPGQVTAEITSNQQQPVTVRWLAADGSVVATSLKELVKGRNQVFLAVPGQLKSGTFVLQFICRDLQESLQVVKLW